MKEIENENEEKIWRERNEEIFGNDENMKERRKKKMKMKICRIM